MTLGNIGIIRVITALQSKIKVCFSWPVRVYHDSPPLAPLVFCMDLEGGNTADGHKVQVWKCTDNDVNQVWILRGLDVKREPPQWWRGGVLICHFSTLLSFKINIIPSEKVLWRNGEWGVIPSRRAVLETRTRPPSEWRSSSCTSHTKVTKRSCQYLPSVEQRRAHINFNLI